MSEDEDLLIEADDYEKNIYFLERDIEEDEFKIFYNTPESFIWKDHPENPFRVSDVIEWKKKVEKWDELKKTLPSKELLQKVSECRIAEQKLEAIKKHLKSIPEKFIIEAYTVFNRGTDEHHLWNFEIWYTDAKNILNSSDFTTNSEDEE